MVPSRLGSVSNFVVLIIQHLLRDFLAFAHELKNLGAAPEDAFIVGIPYSTKKRTVQSLKRMGFVNTWSPTDYPFYDDVRSALSAALDRCGETGKKLLVIEDGGYAVPMLHSEFVRQLASVHGAIEQTANGIWEDERLAEARSLRVPVIDVGSVPIVV